MSEPLVVVGLGNVGPQYERTRHNAGFEVMDLLMQRCQCQPFAACEANVPALITVSVQPSLVLVKPQTGMNTSGEAVRAALERFAVTPSRLLIVYDDVSLPLGRLRFQFTGSAGGHHGIENTIAELGGCKDFGRLRVAVGPDPGGARRFEFVLSRIAAEIEPHYERVLNAAADAVLVCAEKGQQPAMNAFNGKSIA